MDSTMKIGSRVEIVDKNLKGTVAYIGSTQFSSGKWIGVILDVRKGKNNGTVQGKQYFKCDDNFGVFLRQHHISAISSEESGIKSSRKSFGLKSRRSVQLTKSEISSSPSGGRSRLKTPSIHKTASRESSSEVKSEPRVSPVPPPAELQKNEVQSISLHAGGISMMEYETAKAQAKDWKDKFETIRLKRQEDRAKMQEFEKMRIQLQQLSDWKTRASESQQDLMKQLRDAKKEARQAVESLQRYMEDMSDVQETIEMATLDKEMAEEKIETMQQELDLLKEQNDELQTDLEIFKAEMEDGNGEASSYQVKQLEEQNSRLKEALVRMRDLSSAEKIEHQKLEKDMEKKTKQYDELTIKIKKIEDEKEQLESTMDELKEQVDAAQMAEEMVESLTENNLQLEEKVNDLEEQVHDLESMNEMNEELQENGRETEMELREEVDLANARTKEALRKLDATTDIIGDYQDTIKKFRKMVTELQDANENLRSESKSEESSPEKSAPPAINYQIKMVETKAASRSVDLELRKMEVQLANDHVRYMAMFMPSLYNKLGGDRDCVRVLLLIDRICFKSSIIAKHVADRFDVSVPVNDAGDMVGLRGEQVTFACQLVNQLNSISGLMKKYQFKLTTCSVEVFQKVGTLYSELTPHERAIDFISEQLRKDSLDETTHLGSLSKAHMFFTHLYSVHLAKLNMDCWLTMDLHITLAQDLIRGILFNNRRVKAFLKSGVDTSDIGMLLRDVETATLDLAQFCKKLRRRMPHPPSDTQQTMQFDEKIFSTIATNEESLLKLSAVMHELATKCSSAADNGKVTYQETQEMIAQNHTYTNNTVYNAVRLSLRNLMATMNSLVSSLQEGEFDTNKAIKKMVPPVEKRAEEMKSNITTSENLAYKMEEKDAAISDLKKMIKSKADDIGELKIRIGMLERKLEISGREAEEIKSRLQQKIDFLNEESKKKQKEYDETLDALQADIDMLESEKGDLKKRIIAQSKRSNVESNRPASSIASVLASAATATGSVPGTQVIVKDSPMLKDQILALQLMLKMKQIQNCHLMGDQMLKRIRRLTPISVKKTTSPNEKLMNRVNKLKDDLSMLVAAPKVIDISKRQPGSLAVGSNSPAQKLLKQRLQVLQLQEQVEQLKQKTYSSISQRNVGSHTKADFATFPSTQFAEKVNSSVAIVVGQILLPKNADYRKALPTQNVELQDFELQHFSDKVLRQLQMTC